MRLLLDTHTVLWLVMDPSRLPIKAQDAIFAVEIKCFVSIVSLWEMTIKSSKGSLDLPGQNILTMIKALKDYSYDILNLEVADMEYLQGLPHLHKDPFDRLLVAQARRHSMTVVTIDAAFGRYGVPVLWT